jgi:hypothetical protein
VAIYHLHVKNISRRDGRSAVAAAAYRAGETLANEAEEKDSAFGGRRDVVFTEIRLATGAPDWMADRARLWNAVEAAEKRKDARLAKEIEFALPRELGRAPWIDITRQMADVYVTQGHIVDISIHEDGRGNNPHAHLMLTTRAVGPDGFKLKLRDADGVAFVTEAREAWAKIANDALGKAGAGVEIDARSHAARGIEKPPTTHRGPDPAARRARRWGKEMNHDMQEARRELLAEHGTRERFARLAARPDWPPERRDPVPGLNDGEATEWKTFWREVDKRMWGDELYPPREPVDQIILGPRDPVHVRAMVEKLTDEVRRGAATREATLKDALPVWRELHMSMVERMRADGFDTNHPLLDWANMERSLREFDAELTRLRLDEAEREAYRPVPDPDGRPIASRELAEAEERLLEEHERSTNEVDPSPRVGPDLAIRRDDARAAVDRQNAIDVPNRDVDAYRLAPHESRLDWLDQQTPAGAPARGDLEDRLDWLLPREREDRPPDDRERDRER